MQSILDCNFSNEPEPIEVKPSESITSFLEAELDNFMFEDKPQVPETNVLPETSIQYQQPTIVEETTPSLPSWLDRPDLMQLTLKQTHLFKEELIM